ncbi:MAG: 30S ribosomal protein S1 [Elusimicrobia bacterium]|nr:30S ribosomal protein S1 [Elusimicrobiota bacterium]
MNENEPAGAPDEEEDFEALLNSSFKEPSRLDPGQRVEAVIVKITAEWIFLDVGRKGEGYLDRKEMLDEAGNLTVKEGEKVRAYYLPSKDGEMHFTTRIGAGPAGQAQLADAHRSGIPVQGTVAKEVKGGFEVRIGGGVRAFCPFSQMGVRKDENQAEYVGKSLMFKITECAERNVVVSRKAILEVERQEKARALKESMKVGMRVEGKVTSIQKFGAFVDLGGVEGLIPVSEIAWGRTEKVGDKLSVGQAVEVVVKKLDWESNRVSLSMKDALPDPWERAAELWPVGSYHHGTVVRLATFGAFVSMGEGVDGLVHISRMASGRRIGHPREVLKEGQTVEVRVEAVDREGKKLSLSLAAITRAAEEEAATLKAYQDQASAAPQNIGSLGEMLKAKLGQEEDPARDADETE